MTTKEKPRYTVTRVATRKEAERARGYFEDEGITIVIHPDRDFLPSLPWAISVEDKKYLISATLIAEEAAARVNILTNQMVKEAEWNTKLRPTWCDCNPETLKCNDNFLCYPDDGECTCGIYKHHVHCRFCMGVSQVG